MRSRKSKGHKLLTIACFVAASLALASADQALPHFLRGMTALHNFEYEEANEAFRQAHAIDPAFALASWGEAMTYYQVLWRNEDVGAARRALAGLGATPSARAAKATTDKERGLLAAAEILFGEGDAGARHARYAQAMGALSERHPDDADIASLFALALMGTVSRGLIGTGDAHDLHQPGLAGSDVQTRVADILERVLESHPQHAGALHYLIHDYDDPEHARLALPAARAYAKVAGGSSHALHMPAHVFLQLGLWNEAAASDRAAYAASNDWVTRKSLGPAMRNYHALSWLQYELLQTGQFREAWETIGQIEPVVKASGALSQAGTSSSPQPLLSDLSSMRARYVIEARRWDLLAHARDFGNVNELFAIGISAARNGDIRTAEQARQALDERSRAAQEGDLRPAIGVMEREVAALIELTRGRGDAAVEVLRAAANAEGALPPPLGLPAPLKPAPELLGEVLLEIGRPREAVEPFERVLQRNANRSLSVLGLARAAAALGDSTTADRYYKQLLANYNGADADRPELLEARTHLEKGRGSWPAASQLNPIGVSAMAGGALFVLAVLWIRHRVKVRGGAFRKTNSPRKTERTRR
jgi:tetratricopeptide (TPR) repeat protein